MAKWPASELDEKVGGKGGQLGRGGADSRQAVLTEHQLGPLLVTRRGVLAEQAYVAWCDELADMIARRPA